MPGPLGPTSHRSAPHPAFTSPHLTSPHHLHLHLHLLLHLHTHTRTGPLESVSRVIEPITLTKKEYVKLQVGVCVCGCVWVCGCVCMPTRRPPASALASPQGSTPPRKTNFPLSLFTATLMTLTPLPPRPRPSLLLLHPLNRRHVFVITPSFTWTFNPLTHKHAHAHWFGWACIFNPHTHTNAHAHTQPHPHTQPHQTGQAERARVD